MALAWFICSYKRETGPRGMPARYCAIDDFSPQIAADDGDWGEVEVLGNYAVVKVRASETTLSTIGQTVGFYRIPVAQLSDTLGALTATQRTAIKNRILAMGYTDAEITAALGTNLRVRTLAQILRFVASRRRSPRYDAISDTIVLDGAVVTCNSVDDLDVTVM